MKLRHHILLMAFYIFGFQHSFAQLSFTPATNYTVGNMPACIQAADVNGDGYVDLICAWMNTPFGMLSVFTNNGSGVFTLSSSVKVGAQPVSIVALEINGRGKPDLACANNASGTVSILTNNGSGFYGSNATFNIGNSAYCVTATDVNGDGKTDLIYGSGLGIRIYTNSGSGMLVSNATYNVAGVPCQRVMAADVNGDGKNDLLYAGLGEFIIWTNNGVGSFGSNSTINVVFNFGSLFTVADVNQDGKPDLIFADSAISSHFAAGLMLGFVSARGGQAGAFAGRLVHAIEHLPAATVSGHPSDALSRALADTPGSLGRRNQMAGPLSFRRRGLGWISGSAQTKTPGSVGGLFLSRPFRPPTGTGGLRTVKQFIHSKDHEKCQPCSRFKVSAIFPVHVLCYLLPKIRPLGIKFRLL